MEKTYLKVYGTYDFSVEETFIFNKIVEKAKEVLKRFSYKEIILPILEKEDVFIRSIGTTTDIVEKQIFRIKRKDEDDEKIVLRPEGTAQVVRYYLENYIYKKTDFSKFFYIGPMFRGERPQKGRLRQFHHIGVEAVGSKSHFLDAEIIILALKILEEIGVKDKILEINSLGCKKDKENFSKTIREKLINKKTELCKICYERFDKNPLRILDCKEEKCREIVKNLDIIKEKSYLCKDCLVDYQKVIDILNSLNISYIENPLLVRGLDYYTNTVFEITSKKLGAQNAIGAGGRYNNLIKDLSGIEIPAIGFALGIERIMLVLDKIEFSDRIDVYIATIGESAKYKGFSLLNKLRENGFISDIDFRDKSIKSQLRYAQKNNIRFVIIIGPDELKNETFILKDMKKSFQVNLKEDEIFLKLKELC